MTTSKNQDVHYLIGIFIHAKKVRSIKTSSGYQRILSEFEKYLNGEPLSPEAVNGFFADKKDNGRKKSTVRTYYDVLKTWLTWLVKRDYLVNFRFDLIEIPPKGKLVPRAPAKKTLIAIRSFLEESLNTTRPDRKFSVSRDLAVFSILLECGLRIGEVCALTVQDVDLELQKVTVSDSKTSRGRTVYYTKITADCFDQWLIHRLPNNDYFFQTKRHGVKNITVEGMRIRFDEYQKRANVPHFRVHDLRHACAVYRLAGGQNLGDIQAILGHENIETTARYLKAVDVDRALRDRKHSPLIGLE